MNTESFRKGEEFEQFVQNNLFPEKDYTLVHRTDSYEQNKNRFAEDTLKPDFKFRCNKTQKEFYVEAKYRSKFKANKRIDVISFQQLNRFKGIKNEENIPIFIVVGFGGSPSKPKELSLVPIEELKYLELYQSFLRTYTFRHSIIDSALLNLDSVTSSHQVKSDPTSQEASNKPLEDKKPNTTLRVAVGVLLIAIVSMIGFYSFYENTESKIKRKTAEYYKNIEIGNIDVLENYIAPKVNRWYDKSDLTLAQIITETEAYISKYPKSSTEISWDTFKIETLGEDYLCTYKLVYKIKSKGKFKDKIYHLKIDAVWDKDLKLKSISEQRL